MKLGVASAVTAVVCALAASAWAAGDPKACSAGDKKACIEIGTGVANDEPPVGDIDELRADCGKTKDTQSCASLLREETKASCRKGNQRACDVLGNGEAQRIAEENAPTIEELEASCKKKDQQACFDLALSLYKNEPSKKNLKRGCSIIQPPHSVRSRSNGVRRPDRLMTVNSRSCTRSKVVKRPPQSAQTRRRLIVVWSSLGRESFTCVLVLPQ